MTPIDIELVWCSENVPEEVSEVDEMVETSGIWELVEYVAFTGRPTTIIKGIKDDRGAVIGELVMSFGKCEKGVIESEMRSYITSQVVQLLHGVASANKRLVDEQPGAESFRDEKNLRNLRSASRKRKEYSVCRRRSWRIQNPRAGVSSSCREGRVV